MRQNRVFHGMVKEHFDQTIKTAVREYLVVLVLATTAFAFYYIIQDTLSALTNSPGITHFQELLIMGAFYAGVGASATAGAFLSNEFIRRDKLLCSWLFLSIASLLVLTIIDGTSSNTFVVASLIWGVSVGLGMPSSMAYFADTTSTDRRGSVGGVLAFAFIISLFVLAVSLGTLVPVTRIQAFTAWLGISLGILLLFRPMSTYDNITANPKLWSILRNRKLVLYFVPWVIFCLVNSLEAPILKDFFGSVFFNSSVVAEFTISSVSALVGGFFADRLGRKLVAIVGFALLGLGYAILGLFPGFRVSWYLYIVVDGIAWGMFVVVFFIVLWGDLASDETKDKYYLVGGLPYLLSWFVEILVEPYVEVISIYAAFSLASFLLFLAVLPLLYAPETLPERRIKNLQLKQYVEKARKMKEKYT
jgi:MFS family permease